MDGSVIVLDCSAALEVCFDTEKGRAYQALMLEGEEVLAPALFINEMTNALWKYVSAGAFSLKTACDLSHEALTLVDRFYSDRELMQEVLAESVRLGHPSYDMFYLVLAKREGATLLSSDKRLSRLALQNSVDCLCEISFLK